MDEQLAHDVLDYLNHVQWHLSNHASEWDSDERALDGWGRELQQRVGCRLRERKTLELEHSKDSELLDFLADVNQTVANVQLPRHIVLGNVHDMRDAIRETKRQWEAGETA